jgi:type VI protein secretion system component Hcp
LSGRWKGTVASDSVDLTLMSAEQGSIAGVSITHRDHRIYSVELLHFVQTVQGVTLYLRHFSSELQLWEKGDPIALKLESIDGEVSEFKGTLNNQSYRWNINKAGQNSFSIHSEGYDQKGERQLMDFSFTRTK